MNKFLRDHLECYLAGQLGEPVRKEFEKRLADSPQVQQEIEKISCMSKLFGSFAMPARPGLGPSPGFHARVLRQIEQERQPSFWELCLRPPVFRGVAFASCAWLVLLFSAHMYQASAQPSVEHIAEAILAEPPESADYCNVRLGCDIETNRSSMLAAVLVSGTSGR